MPRAAPSQVIEHRLSLQDAERAALLPIATDIQDLTAMVRRKAQAAEVATYVGAGVAVLGTYYVTERWAFIEQQKAGIQEALNGNFWDRLRFGAEISPAGVLAKLFGITGEDVTSFFGFGG